MGIPKSSFEADLFNQKPYYQLGGTLARLELSHDMYSTEYKLAKKDQERDALIRSVPGGLVRVDGRDMRTVLWHSVGF